MIPELTREKVDRHNGMGNGLISELLDIQGKFGYLPEDSLRDVAENTGRSLVEIYGVATFYRAFSLNPRGKHLVSCCLGTACHVRGAPRVADEVQKQLGIASGETTADGQFTLETVNCLGACALGPVMVVDGHYFSQVNIAKVSDILKQSRNGLGKVNAESDPRYFPVSINCPRCNHSLMDPSHKIEGHPSVKVALTLGEKRGWLRLSGLYGSYAFESEFEVPAEEVVSLSCPHCNGELIGVGNCPVCGEKMAPMLVKGGGTLQICPRRGCQGHLLDLT